MLPQVCGSEKWAANTALEGIPVESSRLWADRGSELDQEHSRPNFVFPTCTPVGQTQGPPLPSQNTPASGSTAATPGPL